MGIPNALQTKTLVPTLFYVVAFIGLLIAGCF